MIAVAIVGVIFYSLYSGITAGFAVIQLARENLRATQILEEKMETIRLYNWGQVNSNGFIPATFASPFYATNTSTNTGLIYSGTMMVTNAPITESYSNTMRMVTVSVTWTSMGRQRSRTMSTFVSQYGMQNYIYYQ